MRARGSGTQRLPRLLARGHSSLRSASRSRGPEESTRTSTVRVGGGRHQQPISDRYFPAPPGTQTMRDDPARAARSEYHACLTHATMRQRWRAEEARLAARPKAKRPFPCAARAVRARDRAARRLARRPCAQGRAAVARRSAHGELGELTVVRRRMGEPPSRCVSGHVATVDPRVDFVGRRERRLAARSRRADRNRGPRCPLVDGAPTRRSHAAICARPLRG